MVDITSLPFFGGGPFNVGAGRLLFVRSLVVQLCGDGGVPAYERALLAMHAPAVAFGGAAGGGGDDGGGGGGENDPAAARLPGANPAQLQRTYTDL